MMRRLVASLWCLVPVALVAAAPAAKQAASSKFPAGPEMAKVSAACSGCHAPDVITNARKSRVQWEKAVETMIDRGAKVSDSDYDAVVNYLVRNFGTGK